jgi:hypothetical protein
MKFTYGFTVKTVQGKEYVYFWRYDGTGRKLEQYIGRAGKPKTEKRRLEVEYAYLKSLREELDAKISQLEEQLQELASADQSPKKP